jgi:type IV secretory pathway VirB10-like protein
MLIRAAAEIAGMLAVTFVLTAGREAEHIAVAASVGQPPAKKAVSAGRTSDRLSKFQVAAGSVMQARLRTPVDSSTARVDDQVDAVLTAPVTQNATELIPAGSVLLGKVVSVTAASPQQLLGQVQVVFYVVEHSATGSRAAIESHRLVFQALPAEETSKGRRKKPLPIDVRSSPDQPLNVRLFEPLIVYIPR